MNQRTPSTSTEEFFNTIGAKRPVAKAAARLPTFPILRHADPAILRRMIIAKRGNVCDAL
jgi:hypothetical protein